MKVTVNIDLEFEADNRATASTLVNRVLDMGVFQEALEEHAEQQGMDASLVSSVVAGSIDETDNLAGEAFTKVRDILKAVEIFDRRFELIRYHSHEGHGYHLHVLYDEPDVDNPAGPALQQRSRGWAIADGDGEEDIVNTVFAAVMRSYDHVVREHFYYKGVRVFSPHMHLQWRQAAAVAKGFVKKQK